MQAYTNRLSYLLHYHHILCRGMAYLAYGGGVGFLAPSEYLSVDKDSLIHWISCRVFSHQFLCSCGSKFDEFLCCFL